MKNNRLDNFESLIKSSLDKHKVAYDPSDWNKLNQRLNKMKKPFYSSPWFIAASIVIIIGTTFIISNVSNNEQNNNSSSPKKDDIAKLSSSVDTNEFTSEAKEVSNENVKEVYIQADKEITNNQNISVNNNSAKENNINSETKISVKEEVKIENPKGLSDSLDNDFKPLDTELATTPEASDEIPVTIQKASFYMNTFECCEGTKINFVAEKQENVDFLWSFDDGNYSKDENPTHLFEKAGIYKVNLIVRSQIDNSVMSKSNEQLLIVHPKPIVDFEWEMSEENGIPYTSIIDLTDKATTWNWNFGDGEISNDKNPNHTYRKRGQYLISLTAFNEQGCSSTINKEIIVSEDYNLLAPNSFTPNGDGLNDYFLPAALNRLNGSFTMTIYSVSEGLIYETRNIDQPWDGSNQKAATKSKEGSYVWVVKLRTEEGKLEQYKGVVLLLK